MEFCIPFKKDDKVFTEYSVRKLKAGELADVQEAFSDQTEYHGILKILSSGISSIKDSSDDVVDTKPEIESICRFMPYQVAEQVALDIMVLLNSTDKIEAEFECPRCGKRGYSPEEESIKDINIKILPYNGIDVTLVHEFEPIQIKAKDGSIIQEVNKIEMRYPNINDCINASLVIPASKSARLQYEIYSNAILKVSDQEVDLKWRKMWGRYILERMDFDVLSAIGADMQTYGLDKNIDRICIECGKEWKSPISTSNFFESGLRVM